MSEGVFAVHRGIFKHPRFDGDEYSRREAWLWMVGNAAFAECQVRVGNKMITLQRGQLSYSLRFMAEAWGWSVKRVRTFLVWLKTDTMIGTQEGTEQTLITICNYDDYQFDTGDGARQGARKRARKGHSKGTKNNNDKNDNNYTNNNIPPAGEGDDRGFENFWKAYPRRSTASPKKPAKLKYQAALKRGVAPETILAGARAYAAEQDREGKTGTPYVKTPEVWLNQEGWTAFEAQATGPPLPDDPIARRDLIWKQIEEENAKRAAEAASRSLLARGYGLGQEKQPRPEKPSMVRAEQRDAQGASGVVELFSKADGVSAEGDDDAGRRENIRIPLPRSMA